MIKDHSPSHIKIQEAKQRTALLMSKLLFRTMQLAHIIPIVMSQLTLIFPASPPGPGSMMGELDVGDRVPGTSQGIHKALSEKYRVDGCTAVQNDDSYGALLRAPVPLRFYSPNASFMKLVLWPPPLPRPAPQLPPPRQYSTRPAPLQSWPKQVERLPGRLAHGFDRTLCLCP